MARRYGRAPCGKRLVAAVPHRHWKTTTFVAALRCDGLTAPFVLTKHFCIEYSYQLLCWLASAGLSPQLRRTTARLP
jgi:hypothetical protein